MRKIHIAGLIVAAAGLSACGGHDPADHAAANAQDVHADGHPADENQAAIDPAQEPVVEAPPAPAPAAAGERRSEPAAARPEPRAPAAPAPDREPRAEPEPADHDHHDHDHHH